MENLRYSDYCTCFYVSDEKKVYFYDEISEKVITKKNVKNQDEAIALMEKWKSEAPRNVICQIINQYEIVGSQGGNTNFLEWLKSEVKEEHQ